MLRIPFLLLFSILILGGCNQMQTTGKKSGPFDPYDSSKAVNNEQMMPVESKNADAKSFKGKVAIILPLSGNQSAIGQSMLNASQLAVFDINNPSFELVSFDDKGTTAGAIDAVRQAKQQNAKLILGPLLGENVKAAGQTANEYSLNVIGFTTDSTKIGGNIFTLGILPHDQGERIAAFAASRNLNRVVVISPNDTYATTVIQSFRQKTAPTSTKIVGQMTIDSQTNYNQIATTLAASKNNFDAILMPFGGTQMILMAQALNDAGLGTQTTTWLGTGLWDDDVILANQAMNGAVYAAPSQQQYQKFQQKYISTFGAQPARLASLAYDATALSAVLLKSSQTGEIRKQSILNPTGFAGIDGIFRFKQNGLAERGLAVHQISGFGQTTIIDPAPIQF